GCRGHPSCGDHEEARRPAGGAQGDAQIDDSEHAGPLCAAHRAQAGSPRGRPLRWLYAGRGLQTPGREPWHDRKLLARARTGSQAFDERRGVRQGARRFDRRNLPGLNRQDRGLRGLRLRRKRCSIAVVIAHARGPSLILGVYFYDPNVPNQVAHATAADAALASGPIPLVPICLGYGFSMQFYENFSCRTIAGSRTPRGERDGGLHDITGGPHEGTSRHDLYARYISHARLRTTTRDSDVQRQYFRGTIVTRSGMRARAGLLHATGQTGNFSSRQTAHEIQAFCLISSTAAENERIAAQETARAFVSSRLLGRRPLCSFQAGAQYALPLSA